MPIYEYACSACREVFEELIVRKADEADTRCPACSSAQVERVMSRPASSTRSGGAAAGGGCAPAG